MRLGRTETEQSVQRATKSYRVDWWGTFGFVETNSGADVQPRGRRATAILALAASRPGARMPRSYLAALFWGNRGEEQARASVRQSLSELRDLTNGDEPALTVDQDSIALVPEGVATRDDQLDELSRSGDLAALEEILKRGDVALAGLDGISSPFDEWLRGERAQALEALIGAAVTVVHKAIERGEAAAAQRLISRLQSLDPLDETLARAGFNADAAASDATALARRFRTLEKNLRDDLQVPPSPATVESYRSAAARLRSAPAAPPAPAEPARLADVPSPSIRRPHLIAAGIAVLLLIGAMIAMLAGQVGPKLGGDKTIAVAPFSASADQQALADGISEEIFSRLSRNPRITPLGRNSARIMGEDPANAIALGRELNVDFLLSGSLAEQNGGLSLIAKLVRTSDGEQIWSKTVDGTPAQLIEMVNNLGSEISERIGAGTLRPSTARPPRAEANQLFLTAQGLLREFEPQKVATAIELLRQASRMDPDYAPIWSLLGMATRTYALEHLTPEMKDASPIAQAYARRGLELAPDSALANAAMGFTLAEDPRSTPYVLRAAELDPSDAGIWFTLSDKYLKAGDFVRMKQALDRVVELDPLWIAGVWHSAELNWQLGYREHVIRLMQPIYRHGQPQPYVRHMMRGYLSMRRGDLSRGMDEFTRAADSRDAASRVWADSNRARIFLAIGMADEARHLMAVKPMVDEEWYLLSGKSPTTQTIDISRKYPVYAWNMQDRNYLLLRILVNEGRSAEVASLYDRRFRSPEEFARTPRGHVSFIGDSIPVVLALREVGRSAEADRIYRLARSAIEQRYRAGPVPVFYEALSAQHYAIGGDRAAALAALRRGVDRNWLDRLQFVMPSIAEEPAFRSLVATPQFQRLQKRMEAVFARERAEILAAGGGRT